MIEPLKNLFLYQATDSIFTGVYLDFNHKICLNICPVSNLKDIKILTEDEYLNIRELEKMNLHIPYLLSLLNE